MNVFFDSYKTKTTTFARIVDSAGSDISWSSACDTIGGVYFSGYYTGTPTIEDQAGTSLGTLPASTREAAFVCKFNSYTGTYEYSRIIDSIGTEAGYFVTCDTFGNMYIAGVYNGTPTIKDQAGTSLGTLPASAGDAGFVCKFNSSGVYQYSRIIDSSGSDFGWAVRCDTLGSVYFSGYYTGTPVIKDQAGTTLGNLPTSSTSAAFMCKFNSSGVYQYSILAGGAGSDASYSISCDSNNNVYFGWKYVLTPTIYFISSTGTVTAVGTLPAASQEAAVCSKFNSSGTYQYSFLVEATSFDVSLLSDCDKSNNVYFGGYSYSGGTVSVSVVNSSNLSTTVGTLPISSGIQAFACKFDNIGTYQYSLLVDSSNSDFAWGCACDPSNNFYLTGYTFSSALIKFVNSSNSATTVGTLPVLGSQAAYMCKFDSVGTYQYSRLVDSTLTETGYSASCDSLGNVYFSGGYQGTPTLYAVDSSNVSTSIGTLPASIGPDAAFLVKYDSGGNYW